MRYYLLLPSLLCFGWLAAQKPVDYSLTDKKMSLINITNPRTIDDVVHYITVCFKTDEEKTRAAYFWLSQNISYDVENMYTVNYYESEKEIIDEAMKTRKGVCIHYATLFSYICNKSGIETYVVSRFTRQNDKVDKLTHAWNVASVNSKWELFDPTWGAGALQNNKFVRRLSNEFYNQSPAEFIKMHNPFDPMWQLSNYPLTNAEFIQGKTVSANKTAFNYPDSIQAYKKLSQKEQFRTLNRRMKANGLDNPLLQKQYAEVEKQIGYLIKNDMIDTYNQAINIFNDGVNELNDFINYRNHQFTPALPDGAIRMKLERVESLFDECQKLLGQLDDTDPVISNYKKQLTKSYDTANVNLKEQRLFLDKYMSTSKLFRKQLFYKYTWMGIPLN